MLYLVRHGRPLIDRSRPAHEWELDPAAYDGVWALRASGRLPDRAAWFGSPTGTEPDLDRWRALQMPDLIMVEPLRST